MELMHRLVLKGSISPMVRQFTAALVQNLPSMDEVAEARRLLLFVQKDVRYLKDILTEETLHDPEFILINRYGDCDDKTILFCAMAQSIGYPTAFCAIGTGHDRPTHVYPEILVKTPQGPQWLNAECCLDVPLGWVHPGVNFKMRYEL